MRNLVLSLTGVLFLVSACAAGSRDVATVKSVSKKEIILETPDKVMVLRDLPPGTNWRKAVKRGDQVRLVYDESGKHYQSVQFKNGQSISLE